jgi:hypothetical protein
VTKLISVCALTAVLAFGLAGPAPAAEQAPVAAAQLPAASLEPQIATPAPTPAAPVEPAPVKPDTGGAQIGVPEPIFLACPGIAYCRNFCAESGGPSCVAVYKCYANGTWSCQCYGPGGGPCL